MTPRCGSGWGTGFPVLVLVLVLLLETQHGFPTAPPAAKPRLVPAALVILFAKG
jgi:hypothetical protein